MRGEYSRWLRTVARMGVAGLSGGATPLRTSTAGRANILRAGGAASCS